MEMLEEKKMELWNEIDQLARNWINQAGDQIRASFQKTLNIESKANRNDLVTNIDKETEQFFIGKIKSTYPEHRILGEEGFGDELKSMDGIVWIIDPIDGTMNFIHQQRNFAISIGVYENGIGKLAYIYDVVHDELYFAKKGEGAFLNGERIQPLRKVKTDEAIIALNATWLVTNKHLDHHLMSSLVRKVRGVRSYGSAALEMVYVATGRLDAYISPRLAPWDYAAGKLMVEEVGGKVSTFEGNEVSLIQKGTLFVSNPFIYDELLNDYIKVAKIQTDRK